MHARTVALGSLLALPLIALLPALSTCGDPAMMADPGNLDKTFAFAGLAVDVGDIDGAISALERMLLIDPNLPRVKLELGVLYFAASYLQAFMAGAS